MSNQSSFQPDLDDHSNVTANAAAASRENQMFSEKGEPFTLPMLLVIGVLVFVGCAVLLMGGNLFDYNNTAKVGYSRPKLAPKPVPAMDANMALGGKMFSACIVCHKADGTGDGAAFPPLANSDWVSGPSLRPAMIILNGLSGPITVDGKSFGSSVMTPQSHIKSAKELAAVLNYIRNSFGNKNEKLISVEMAQKAFSLTKERGEGKTMTADELNASFNKELEGTTLDAATLVNPKTLLPVE